MEARTQGARNEDLTILGPLRGLFIPFRNLPPTYTFREAMEPILTACQSRQLNVDHEELEAIMESCEELATNQIRRAASDGVVEALSVHEIASLAMYTASFYTDPNFYEELNRLLRTADRQALKPFKNFIWMMMWALKKSPVFRGGVVFRGVKGANIGSQYRQGEEVCWHQFSSCTSDLTVQQNDQFLGDHGSRTLFNIEITTGRARVLLESLGYYLLSFCVFVYLLFPYICLFACV